MSTYLNFSIRSTSPYATTVRVRSLNRDFKMGVVSVNSGERLTRTRSFEEGGATFAEALVEAVTELDTTLTAKALVEIADLCSTGHATPMRGDNVLLATCRTYPGADVLVVGNTTVINGEVHSPTGKVSPLVQAYLDGTIYGAVDELIFG